jgi:1,4-alpha-glucan branching enzyme
LSRIPVELRYCPGVARGTIAAVTIAGDWDAAGEPSPGAWTAVAAAPTADEFGMPAFAARVELDAVAVGTTYRWGAAVRLRDGATAWGIAAEVPDEGSTQQHRTFVLGPPGAAPQVETYRLAWHRARGAQRLPGADGRPAGIAFTAWAPNARAVDVVFGGPSGYIADDGHGADPSRPALPATRQADGTWRHVAAWSDSMAGRPYLFRVTRDDGSVNFATDMFSRRQAGQGDLDPRGAHYDGTPERLDGRPSCSVVVDLDAGDGFWAGELDPDRPVPHRVEDLVIYELHVGALAPQVRTAGTFADAIALLPYLEDLGINAVELMPMLQFDGTLSWGYGSSQFLAIDSAAGGRDGLRAFVRACHQRGIAVLMDVVYNHFAGAGARAAWQYDSIAPSRNSYYWYEGTEAEYPAPEGGYVDNDSSGWAPRYWEEHVRALFVSSAVMLADELHIDGLRVDQTAAIHAYNRRHADGAPVPRANIFGRKFLRELCQTMKTLWPDQVLIAEDHSGWSAVTEPAGAGGLGFDATWYVDFYHHLIGELGRGPEWAKLLLTAGQDPSGPLAMGRFAGALAASGGRRVVYESSHDEAGNDQGTERTILVAVNGAPLVGETRRYAEARCRFACGMTMLSAGTPMFLMGEEVGAQRRYTYDKFFEEKEDLPGLRATTGALLFRFYEDVIRLRLGTPAIRSRNLEVVAADDASRVIAFRRWDERAELLVAGSLSNAAYDRPDYVLRHPSLGDGHWRERLNSDSHLYGGDDAGNAGAELRARGGELGVVIPANGFVVLFRTG